MAHLKQLPKKVILNSLKLKKVFKYVTEKEGFKYLSWE